MGQNMVVTDEQLLADLREGLSSAQIATKHGISVAAVNKRRARLRFQATTVAVVAKPEAAQLAAAELDTISLLQVCMQRLVMLSDAYHEWLLDPKDSRKYTIEARTSEVDVVYFEPGHEEPTKKTLAELLRRVKNEECRELVRQLLRMVDDEADRVPLQELLQRIEERFAVQAVEVKRADPRVELRNTVTTIGNTVAQMVELAQMLADARAMQTLRDAILEELRRVDEEIAARVVSALRSRLVVGGVPGRTGGADATGASGDQQRV